jgi:hypothetical protein
VPKNSGQDLKTVQLAPSRPAAPVRSIKRFDAPPLDHRIMPAASASPGAPKIAADVKKSGSDSVDPTQQHY